MTRSRSRSRSALPVTAALVLSIAPGHTAGADGDTLKLTLSTTVSYDSNLFRLPASVDPRTVTGRSERSDVITTTGVGVLLDRPIGRQRVIAEVRGTRNDFSRFDFLNNSGYDARAVWQYQVGNDVSGDIGYSRKRALTSFGDFRVPVRNMETTERPYVNAKYRVAASAALRAQVGQVRTSNSTAVRTPGNRDENSYELGADYLPSTGNTIGIFARRMDGKLPNRIIAPGVSDSFTQDEAGSAFNWRLTGHSLVTGYVAYTQRRHEQSSQRDFDGASGRITFDWTPTGKSRVVLNARREISAYEDIGTTYALTQSIGIQGDWQATGKVAVSARAEYRDRDFLGDATAALPGFLAREDKTHSYGASVVYKAMKNMQIAGNLGRERRSSNRALLDYEFTNASVTAQFDF